LLASCRRELEATKVLRDEDLNNVQLVRSKLAEKTRELERLQAQTGRVSPSRTRPGSFFERRNTTDLFTAAKVAALEQRALELEKRNEDLVTRLEASRGGDDIDDLNRLTAHQAWKGTVAELESKIKTQNAELERLRPGGASAGASTGAAQMDWYRIEALLEEHASYRENVGGKLQALRSEKETLQKDLHRKENECQGLELKVQTLQRRISVL
jgi:chromosome segregation ATPase